jgi:hypothetical protein
MKSIGRYQFSRQVEFEIGRVQKFSIGLLRASLPKAIAAVLNSILYI